MHPVTRAILQGGIFKGKAAFDGVGDYLSIPYSADFDFGTLAFTIERSVQFLALPASGAVATLYSRWVSVPVRTFYVTLLNVSGTYKLNVACYNTTAVFDLTVNWTPTIGVKYDIAVVRSGNDFYFFVDGIQIGATQTASGSVDVVPNTVATLINSYDTAGSFLNGYDYGIRVTKNEALYTSAYSPPSSYSVGANTKLCINFAEALGSTTFIDDTGKTVTTHGNVVIVE